jgi:glycosyltransferase involved in cell wall biosynthesis
MRRILVAAGNPRSAGFRGGQPYYFYATGRAFDFIHEALPLAPEKLAWMRRVWNMRNLVVRGSPFGFQYSSTFRKRLFASYGGGPEPVEYISYFPLLPPEPWRSHWSVNYYIDATLKQNFEDYGIGAKLSRRTRVEAADQERRNYEKARRIVCRSVWAAASVVSDYGIRPEKVHVILPGASLDEPVVEEVSSGARPSFRPLRLGMVGKDWRRKGLQFLLRVTDELSARGFEAEVIVIGPEPRELPAHRSIRPLGYLDKATQSDRLLRELRSCHFGCLFSSAEALSSFLRECLRLGVPVLARRVGGIPDAVPAGLGHLFEPAASPQAVADLLIGYAQAPDRYAALRREVAGRAAEFSWDRTLEKFVALWAGSDEFSYRRVAGADAIAG